MNMQEIGYFLYMQQQEEKQQQEHIEVNVIKNIDLVGEQARTKEERDRK